MTWQPISTAPKDGTKVLLGRFVKECAYGRNGEVQVDRYVQPEENKGYTGWGRFNDRFWPATHWQHLPPPPQNSSHD